MSYVLSLDKISEERQEDTIEPYLKRFIYDYVRVTDFIICFNMLKTNFCNTRIYLKTNTRQYMIFDSVDGESYAAYAELQ